MTVKQFLAGPIGTNCYLLINEKTKEAVIVDPASCPDYMMNYIKTEEIKLKAVLLTHAHFDHIMGIDDDGIKKVGQDIEKVTLGLLEEMVDEDSELISIYYGADTTKEQAEALLEKVEETYGDCDVQLEYGGQPIYYFLLSVE